MPVESRKNELLYRVYSVLFAFILIAIVIVFKIVTVAVFEGEEWLIPVLISLTRFSLKELIATNAAIPRTIEEMNRSNLLLFRRLSRQAIFNNQLKLVSVIRIL